MATAATFQWEDQYPFVETHLGHLRTAVVEDHVRSFL